MLGRFVTSVLAPRGGGIDPRRLSMQLKVEASTLARIAGVHRNTLQRNPQATLTQERLGLIVKVIARAAGMLGDDRRAIAWFRYQPLAGFERKTAEEMVSSGQAAAVLAHLDTLEHGGFA
jgi:uncharacterized protein (DUF2384 family)